MALIQKISCGFVDVEMLCDFSFLLVVLQVSFIEEEPWSPRV